MHLKTISFVGHKLYFNLYGTFPIKSNDVTFIALFEVDQKVNQSCPNTRTHFGFRATLTKGFDPLKMLTSVHCFKDIK